MCTAWGIPSSGASVWRLYRAYIFKWRLRLARESAPTTCASPQELEKKADEFLALRTYEILANPHSPTAHLVDLARIQVQRKSYELAREVYCDNKQKSLDRALDALAGELRRTPEAEAHFDQLKAILMAKAEAAGEAFE